MPYGDCEAPRQRPICCGHYMYLAFTSLDAFYCGTCGSQSELEPWRPLRPKFCKLLDFPEHYSWEAIYEEVELMKRRLSQLSDVPTIGSSPPAGEE